MALGDVRHLARRDHGRARVEGARLRQDLGGPRHYAQNELAVEAFKKNFPAELAKIRARLPKGVEIELWWQAEARIGQKNKLTRWARRDAPAGAPRPAHRMGLYLRRDLSREGERRRAGHALVRHRRHGGAPHRDQCRRRSRRPCGADRRSGRLALDAQAGDPRQHHRPGAAATIARVEPGGGLAIHARQLVVEPDLQILRSCAVLPSGTTSSWKIMSLGMRKWAHGF